MSERIPVRRDFFVHVYEKCREFSPEIFADSSFDRDDAEYLAGLYFLLSDAYKRYRMKENHFTNGDKKAGITLAAVIALRPIQFYKPVADEVRFYANQVFGIACATAILDQPFSLMPDVDKRLFYNWLDSLRFPCTVPFIVDARAGARVLTDNFLLRVTYPEVSQLDMLIHKLRDIYMKLDLQRRILNLEANKPTPEGEPS